MCGKELTPGSLFPRKHGSCFQRIVKGSEAGTRVHVQHVSKQRRRARLSKAITLRQLVYSSVFRLFHPPQEVRFPSKKVPPFHCGSESNNIVHVRASPVLHLPAWDWLNVAYLTGGQKHSVGCRERTGRKGWSDKKTQPRYRKREYKRQNEWWALIISTNGWKRRINDKSLGLSQRAAEKDEGQAN